MTRKYFLWPVCKHRASCRPRLDPGRSCPGVVFGGLLARRRERRVESESMEVDWLGRPSTNRGWVDYMVHGITTGHNDTRDFRFERDGGARAWKSVLQGVSLCANLCGPAIKSRRPRQGNANSFYDKNSAQVYQSFIRLEFVAITGFVRIQSSSLSATYGFLIRLFSIPTPPTVSRSGEIQAPWKNGSERCFKDKFREILHTV